MRTCLFILTALSLLASANMAGAAQAGEDLPELASVLSLFSAQAITPEGVRLNWDLDHQSPTILKFRIYRGYEEVGNFAVLTELNVRPERDSVQYVYSDTSALPGVSYFYKLASVGQSRESVFPVVITATPPLPGQKIGDRVLPPVSVLPGSDKIRFYVRRPGRVKLAVVSPAKDLVNDFMRSGIYEFDPPARAGSLTLHIEHKEGYKVDILWPTR
jgi:hypothetical protein